MSNLEQFDPYLGHDGPSALIIREQLIAAEGEDAVVFPATYAAGDGFPGGYNIDASPNGTNVCLIDSVGSQANRIEPLFKETKFKGLVPEVIVTAGNEHRVNILDAGHRAGDAIVRCTDLQKDLQDAFKNVLKGNAEPLAKIAPTSIVFGVWDSRDTQAKLPRLVSSTIRAYNVRRLTRSAQYVPALRYTEAGLLESPADKATKEAFSQRGFLDAPATASHGGVIADGGIRRDATLALAALRLLAVPGNDEKTLALRRYILGLALVAFTYRQANYLRQGCLLTVKPGAVNEFKEVYPDGARKDCHISAESALQYATEAAEAFGVGEGRVVNFDTDRAKKDVLGEGDTKTKAKKAKKE